MHASGKSESMQRQDEMTVGSDLALGMHPSIGSAATLHAQSFSALLPDLAQGPFQHSLDCGHCIALPPLQLKAPASPPLCLIAKRRRTWQGTQHVWMLIMASYSHCH